MDNAEIYKRFQTHRMSAGNIEKVHKIREKFKEFAVYLNFNLPDGREKSIILTNLEESMFYSTASIAREGKVK